MVWHVGVDSEHVIFQTEGSEAESPLCSFNHCLWSTVKYQTDMSTIWPCHGL